ncbi:MAG: Gfo/Idh/MocA family oxidoreductase [Verrucomicrobia bacterium]|jgi:predicted dehydrogenase|nr:Gfo/Idh/MocA family oxidoreductase [Verrucomicrobiota bacterium]OQC25385.1 MAG: Glucose--fructose oxidoreductase precursor [Verrucomicrobia bacterium ADurb.Bin063]MBP8015626.1 Gfo/Idh/MocA family oxidoreductase [Verrucomicrobiota bacterium]HNZ75508.1 Gfo/Idh/MocA family oxidoreductase [Verrucomicrobiota bacterium]HOC50593.1 Gfo/Idh/MocA family oxidoreductase [Verrucomicrobiota bacterium]
MTTPQTPHGTDNATPFTRRRFLAGTGASVLAFTVLKPGLARAAGANAKINLGLIGCGKRGKWIAELFEQHGGYHLVAVADYFQERVDAVGEQLQVGAAQRFTGLQGYRRLLEQQLDAVVIESPPYFHPEQAAAAVEAGKHVYMAKPVAVDVPGCLSIDASGRAATAKQRCFLVDFQTRANPLYQAAVQAVRAGEIGKLFFAEASYHCGPTWDSMDQLLRQDPKNPEVRLRAWGVDRVLSGDVITEQNIHALDVACWMLGAEPLRACGTGGRKREFVGNCWDHFAVIYHFPNDLVLSFNSRQSGYGYDDILCRVYGSQGTADTHYFGNVTVKAKEFHSDGKVGNLYHDGVVANIATFHDCITRGDWTNPTVTPSVRSNLTTILGRMASYRNGTVTWPEMMQAKEKLEADFKGLKA